MLSTAQDVIDAEAGGVKGRDEGNCILVLSERGRESTDLLF